MGRIVRNVALNPVEPAQLSFRAPYAMQTVLDITFTDYLGQTLNYDIAAQLQLISRTNGRTASYATPATDIVNGKARAVFPAGELNDRNGYHLRLFGTLNGSAELLAMGEVRLTATTGPMAMPDDIIDEIPLTFTIDTPVQIDITLWQDEAKATPYDLSVVTVIAAVYPSKIDNSVLANFGQQVTGINALRLSLPAPTVNTLPASCWWSLRVSSSGQVKTLAEGTVVVVSAPAVTSEAAGGLP